METRRFFPEVRGNSRSLPPTPRWRSTKGFAHAWSSKEHGLALAWVEDGKVTSTEVKPPGRVSGYPRYTPTRAYLSHSPPESWPCPRKGRGSIRPLGSSESFSRSYPAVSTKGSFGQLAEGLPPSHKIVAATPHSGGSRKTYSRT